MIDTVRYAKRLKAAGVEDPLAEEMSQALNDELIASLLKEGPLGAGREAKAPDEPFDRRAARAEAQAALWMRQAQLSKDQRNVLRRVVSRRLALPERKARYNPLALWRETRAEYRRLRKETKALAAMDRDWVKDHLTQIKVMRVLILMLILALALSLYLWILVLFWANPPVLAFLGTILFGCCACWAYTHLHFLD